MKLNCIWSSSGPSWIHKQRLIIPLSLETGIAARGICRALRRASSSSSGDSLGNMLSVSIYWVPTVYHTWSLAWGMQRLLVPSLGHKGVYFARSDHGWINLDKAEPLRQSYLESLTLTQPVLGVPWPSLSLQTKIRAERTRDKRQMNEFNDWEINTAHPGQNLASSLPFHSSSSLPSGDTYQIPYPTSTSPHSRPCSLSLCHSAFKDVCCVFLIKFLNFSELPCTHM